HLLLQKEDFFQDALASSSHLTTVSCPFVAHSAWSFLLTSFLLLPSKKKCQGERDAVQLLATIQAYAAAARGESVSLDAPLPATPEPLTEPPFYALEVVPSITFTYGGLRSDLEGRVLDHDSIPVSGLWVGGVDAGGLSNWTYAGGLAA